MIAWPLRLLISYDAKHFLQITKYGYTHEQSHAFLPGFPMFLNAILPKNETKNWTDYEIIYLYCVQLALGSLCSILLYNVCLLISKNQFLTPKIIDIKKRKFSLTPEQIAHGAVILFSFNQSLVYTISLYNELLYTFF